MTAIHGYTDEAIAAMTVVQKAAAIRSFLREYWAGTKFSVRSSSFSQGSAIDIRWAGGPKEATIDRAINDFRTSRFQFITTGRAEK